MKTGSGLHNCVSVNVKQGPAMFLRHLFFPETNPRKKIAHLLTLQYRDKSTAFDIMKEILQQYNLRDINDTINSLTDKLEKGKINKKTAAVLSENLGYLKNLIAKKSPASPLSGAINDLNSVNRLKTGLVGLLPKYHY